MSEKILVIGAGNVGTALLPHLAADKSVSDVGILCRVSDHAQAAIFDTASAHPEGALKFHVATAKELSASDVIVVTSGLQIEEAPTRQELYQANVTLVETIFRGVKLKTSAIVIVLATPVDDVTPAIRNFIDLPASQVLGFGGDLDNKRLEYILRLRGLGGERAIAVGEHGRNAIPVYEGEGAYELVTGDVQGFLSRVSKLGGRPRNLATGELLGRLVHSIVNDSGRLHSVTSFHPQFGCYLNWPFRIGANGASDPLPVVCGPKAKAALSSLVEQRRLSQE